MLKYFLFAITAALFFGCGEGDSTVYVVNQASSELPSNPKLKSLPQPPMPKSITDLSQK